jgi:hypothetical protein
LQVWLERFIAEHSLKVPPIDVGHVREYIDCGSAKLLISL